MNKFVLFDSRASDGRTDRAGVLATAPNAAAALALSSSFAHTGAVWFEYRRCGCVLYGETMRADIGQKILEVSL